MSLQGPIILIEDDEDDQFMITKALHELKLSNPLKYFGNGEEALVYLEMTPEKPFLILCDINMPLMNGLELRQRVHQNEYLRQKSIPFVFLTTATNESYIELAYKESVQGFYKKAATYQGLLQQLRTIVDYWQSCLHPSSRIIG